MYSKYQDNGKYTRWERQKEVLLLLNDNWFSVKDLSDYLEISIIHADCLLRHYHKNHQLRRKKIDGKFSYILTEYGLNHLKWLEDGGHLEYVEWYNQKYDNNQESGLDRLNQCIIDIKKLKNKIK